MPKYNLFFNLLSGVVNTLHTKTVKSKLGDSINNNRALTVSQVIRFLESRRNSELKNLSQSLDTVFELLKEDIIENRNNHRTDAIDINEFLNFYAADVVILGNNRNVIGRSISI